MNESKVEMSQEELTYRRELYRRGTRNVNQRDWNDWEWYSMRRVTIDVSVPITDGYVGDVVAGFRDQLD